jgi:hypothetical protein
MVGVRLAFLLALALSAAHAADSAERARIFPAPAFSNVVLSAPTRAAAMEFLRASDSAIGDDVAVAAANPVCCLYITLFPPNPGRQGFAFIHQGGGSLLVASSEAEVLRALVEIAKRAVREDGEVRYPVGVVDGYR